ncbi:MAG: 4Fe-4S binding protein [Phycisphaerae bacterium]|nr:4Fe-4S binding protein [Phycisphaerae bacterium]
MPFVIQVNAGRCTGCKSCEIACALAHSKTKELAAAAVGEPEIQPRIDVRKMGEMAVPVQCRHCEDAPCEKACPNDALRRDAAAQAVIYDPERCQGTNACMSACPYGVLEEGPDGHVLTKCDLCAEQVEAGGSPACVSACPTGALQIVDMDDTVSHRVRWLVDFVIDKDACKACGLCKKACPVEAIEGKSGKKEKTPHAIDESKCVRCGRCFDVCPFDSVRMNWQKTE